MENEKLYTPQFFLLCLSSVLFMASFNMIIAELPSYLAAMGGEQYIGYIIFLFTVTAGISRPFSGKLADTIGRIPVMVIGATVSALCSLVYPFITAVLPFLLLRLFHGFSTGFKPTGTTAFLADIVPVSKRGEAMGILGVSGSVGMASGPAIGSYIAKAFSTDIMFYCSSITALFSVLVVVGMKETITNRERFRPGLLKIGRTDIFERRVLPPSIAMILTAFSFGTILTITPDFSDHLEISNRGLYLTFSLAASIAVRLFSGKASDRYGRRRILMIGTFLLTTAMAVTASATSPEIFFTGAVIFGISVGINSPTIFAWTVDLSSDEHRGKAMATMFIALELGIGMGALLSGYIYKNDSANFKYAYSLCACLAFLAFLYTIWLGARKKETAIT